MCSDGFWEYVTEAAMEAALQRVGSPEEWLAAMEQLVIDSGRPGQDNYSAVAVWVGPMDFSTRTSAGASARRPPAPDPVTGPERPLASAILRLAAASSPAQTPGPRPDVLPDGVSW
jgi:hypothetical protein